MLIRVGSLAAKSRSLCQSRPVGDLDLVGRYDEIMAHVNSQPGKIVACYPIASGKKLIVKKDSGKIFEGEITWKGSTAATLAKLVRSDPDTIERSGFLIPSIHVLYMLKMSHRYLKNSPHFLKTMLDIRELRAAGAEITPRYEEFFKRREAETYSYAHPKLNVSKDGFFTGDGVEYVYDHDSIHEAVKHLDRPAYLYYKHDDADVMCAKDKFFAADEMVRLYGVLEESYVLALERSQIPHHRKLTPRQSFEIALMKVCTSITSGWFREYAWENYELVDALYDDKYAQRFWAKVRAQKVRLHV